MERNIVQIGNSMGVILPASILKRLNLSAKDPVTITHRNNSIIIKPVPRRNWEAAASQMHAAGDDNLIMPDIFFLQISSRIIHFHRKLHDLVDLCQSPDAF